MADRILRKIAVGLVEQVYPAIQYASAGSAQAILVASLCWPQFPDFFPVHQIGALGNAHAPAARRTGRRQVRRKWWQGKIHQVMPLKLDHAGVFGKRATQPRVIRPLEPHRDRRGAGPGFDRMHRSRQQQSGQKGGEVIHVHYVIRPDDPVFG